MVHGDGGHSLRFREPEVDGDSAASVVAQSVRAPIGNATAIWAKMKANSPVTPGISVRWPYDPNTLTFVVVGPKRPVAVTDVAVTGSGGLRYAVEAPTNGAAMTSAFDHLHEAHFRKAPATQTFEHGSDRSPIVLVIVPEATARYRQPRVPPTER